MAKKNINWKYGNIHQAQYELRRQNLKDKLHKKEHLEDFEDEEGIEEEE